MRFYILWISLMALQNVFGQSFNKTMSLAIAPSENIVKLQWADINNDSLLDIVVGYKDLEAFKVSAFINGITTPWPIQNLISTTFVNEISFELHDVNKDNTLDVIALNEVNDLVQYYLNNGNFTFTKSDSWGSREVFIKGLQIVDLNNDGSSENIWTDGSGLYIGAHQDTLWHAINSFQAIDLDGNGFRDLLVSGKDNTLHPLTFLWFLGDDFSVINRVQVAQIAGQIATGDINHDGYFDVLMAGEDPAGHPVTQVFQNNKTSFDSVASFTGLQAPSIKIADFTSDGLADIALLGGHPTSGIVNEIRVFPDSSIQLPAEEVKRQEFGDYDRDGDLDIVQLTEQDTLIANEFGAFTTAKIIRIYTNNLVQEKNQGPASASKAFGLPVYDRMFFYWEKPGDDHTNTNSITYDLKVFNEATTIVASEFDQTNHHRLLVSHGNRSTANYSLQKIQGSFAFEIQTIDNAFMTKANGICRGNTGGPGCSAVIDEQNIISCQQQEVALTPPAPQAMWFSFNEGFLGIADNFTFDNANPDTVFSFNPSFNGACPILRLYNIQPSLSDTIHLSHTRYDCEGRNITLEISPEWDNITWKNNLNSTVATGQTLVHNLKKEVIFTAFASNHFGCQLRETFDLKLSKPNLQLGGAQYQIVKGSSVQLSASGGQFYVWTPATSLSDDQIASPIASPVETTEYTVEALDSLGCSAKGKVLVEVFEEAFIPTLFTPNGDGRNDNIKIYGLSQASGFRFAIYNREGNTLFETSSVSEATNSGWSGTVNGTTQPPGTYYWKVEGRASEGELLLNGKRTGAFLLVR